MLPPSIIVSSVEGLSFFPFRRFHSTITLIIVYGILLSFLSSPITWLRVLELRLSQMLWMKWHSCVILIHHVINSFICPIVIIVIIFNFFVLVSISVIFVRRVSLPLSLWNKSVLFLQAFPNWIHFVSKRALNFNRVRLLKNKIFSQMLSFFVILWIIPW